MAPKPHSWEMAAQCGFFFLMEKKVSTSSFSIYNFLVTKMFNSFFFQINGSEVNAVSGDTRHASELSTVTPFILE